MKKNYKQKKITNSDNIKNGLINLIEQKANNNPNKIALYYEEHSINYQTLNHKTNQLAHYIRTIISTIDQRIIIYLDRDPTLIISILAVLKTKNIYIPIVVGTPESLISEIINDSYPVLMITTSNISNNIKEIIKKSTFSIINLNEDQKIIEQMNKNNIETSLYYESAYILYTSGTTGKPKGVEIAHRSIENLIKSMKKELGFDENDVMLAITPLSFDLSVPDIFLPLTSGGTIVLSNTNTRFNPNQILYFITQFNISVMQATPTTWQMLLESNWQNESNIKIICGGEALSTPLAKKLRAISDHVWNFYGPTETTVWSTSYKIDTIDDTHPIIAIGKPIANTEVYVLDESLQQQAVNVPGELYIGGVGVAVGYLNRPELNQKCFITNPFSGPKHVVPSDARNLPPHPGDPSSQATQDDEKHNRLYKTGDLVVQDSEGHLHYLGRIDTQIKIRGHRIEASAIENVMLDYQGIKECVVVDKNPEQQHELVAYLILTTDELDLKALQDHLRSHFPSYMIPTRYVVVNAFPVTANGKIDRKNMCHIKPFSYLLQDTHTTPLKNKYEEIVTDLIQSFLQRTDIDPESNFFDLGLHSMLLMTLAQALNRILNQSISVVDLFEHPSVRRFSEFLLKTHPIDYQEDTSVETQHRPTSDNAIAVIGLACKVPGADDYHSFWDLILQKKESITFFDEDALQQSGIDSQVYRQKAYVPARGILSNIDSFDAAFFGYTPAEARIMDPQHRVFLEQSWSALEDAGYCAEQVSGTIGIYAGMNDSTYLSHHLLQNAQIKAEYDQQQLLLATSTHYLSTKVAYALGLKGPSVTVNTACSTGLVSIAMACNSLIHHDCDMALAGAITIVTPQESGYLYQELGILSPDGHCRVFDEQSQGTVLSNGCGVVVLKRLSDALKDNDRILGVIKGWAINNDGSRKVGFTAPSVDGQRSCVKDALMRANIKPTDVEYMEAHGTGTLMGDPIEIASLSKAYGYETHQRSHYCALGSVKANIGHTDSASGAIGFIKTILALHHKTLPPQINFVTGNPNIDFEHSPYYVNCEARPWETTHPKRTAAVHALGFGGTNAHVIIQEAPEMKTTRSKAANICLISAKTQHALQANTQALNDYLLHAMKQHPDDNYLADVAYTLQMGRQAFPWRTAIAYQNLEHLLTILKTPEELNKHTLHRTQKKSKRIIFGFTGQGSQYAGMAADIYREHPYFKQIVDNCCIDLQAELGIDLRTLLFPKTIEDTALANEQLRQTHYTQPALFVIEYALAQLLMSFGIKPHAMIGHSIGEYVAATISGVLSLKDSLQLISARSKLMAQTQHGSMLVVPLSMDDIKPYLNQHIELVAQNAPKLNVVAGTREPIAQFEKDIQPLLAAHDLQCKTLITAHAFHSQCMDPILEAFYDVSAQYETSQPKIPYVSNVTGDWISQKTFANKRYWTDHLRQTVLFSKGVDSLALNENDVLIEIGPGRVITQLIQQHDLNSRPLFVQTLTGASDSNHNSYEGFIRMLGTLWLHHLPIHWEPLYTNEIRQRCALPTYAFEKHAYWVDASQAYAPHSLRNQTGNLLYKPIWEQDRKLSSNTILKDNTSKACLLIFCDDPDKCALFSKHLPENVDLFILSSGLSFQRTQQHVVLDPLSKADYTRSFNALSQDYEDFYVMHTWFSDNLNTQDDAGILAKGPYSLLYLTQAFNEIYPDKPLKALVVTTEIQSVLGNESIQPIKATILGPCKVIPQEHPHIHFKSIDLDPTVCWNALLIQQLYGELITVTPTDFKDDFAYRGRYRWIKQLEPYDETITTLPFDRFKQEGVYIITGGLGGIGLSIAAHLAKRYHAKLVLLTRSAFPLENEWQAYVDQGPHTDQKQYEIIKTLLSIKKEAHTLTVASAAVEHLDQLQCVIQSIKKRFSHIHGVIHAAGVAGGGLAQFKSTEHYEQVLKPKLQGTRNLIQCLQDEPLDLMVLISSITAITGFPGQIDYCSANCVLDAYVHKNDNFKHPVFCVSMNWLAWRDVGMAANSKTLLMRLDEHNSISVKEGCAIFETIVNAEYNQIIISKEDLNHYERPHLASSEADDQPAHASNVIDTLLDLWQKILGIEHIHIDDDFYELGGHSLLAVSLLSKIRHQFDVTMPSTTLFQAKTIRALASVIESQKQEQEDYSPLVVLRQGCADKPALFMIHPVGGTVFCYMQLAHSLETDRTLYAFQDPSIEAEHSLFSNIEDMAAFYLEHIQKIQEHGPYYLCGASFGALVVTEMAHLLEQQQEILAFIGIIDGWGTHGLTDFDTNYVKDIITLHHPDHQNRLTFDKQSLWESLLHQRLNMMLDYHYKSIHSPVILFKAQELLPEYQVMDAPDNHWSPYLSSLTVRVISGDHNTMMQAPHVAVLREEIEPYLK